MKRAMRLVVNAIKRYNAQDEKVSKRYEFEMSRFDGMIEDFNGKRKSTVLKGMEQHLSKLESDVYRLALDVDCGERMWDFDIASQGLCIDSWNYRIVFAMVNDKAA